MRYFAELSYKGTDYNGWQRQDNAPSVQRTLEDALSVLLRDAVAVTGAGRTDTGVHAAYYVAHFDTGMPVADCGGFVRRLNSILPHDIAVSALTPVADEAHARFDAVEREYRYYILSRKDPFRRATSWQYYVPLDVDAMNAAAAALTRAADFTTFSKLHSNNKTDICDVSHATWVRDGDSLVFTIRADRFLRNMVRAIAGTLVDVGRGKIMAGQFASILEARDRSLASGSAPAQGLFLTDVRYPEKIFRRTVPF